jgi:hypothetical protein
MSKKLQDLHETLNNIRAELQSNTEIIREFPHHQYYTKRSSSPNKYDKMTDDQIHHDVLYKVGQRIPYTTQSWFGRLIGKPFEPQPDPVALDKAKLLIKLHDKTAALNDRRIEIEKEINAYPQVFKEQLIAQQEALKREQARELEEDIRRRLSYSHKLPVKPITPEDIYAAMSGLKSLEYAKSNPGREDVMPADELSVMLKSARKNYKDIRTRFEDEQTRQKNYERDLAEALAKAGLKGGKSKQSKQSKQSKRSKQSKQSKRVSSKRGLTKRRKHYTDRKEK